jgi:hypothetical protein
MEYIVIGIIVAYFVGITGWNIHKYNKSLKNKPAKLYEFEAPPLGIYINNPTEEVLTCVLFGASKNLFSENYGSSKGLVVHPDNSVSYAEILLDSLSMPARYSKFRFASSNNSQLEERVIGFSYNKFGQSLSAPFQHRIFSLDGTFIEIEEDFDITRNTQISFKVLPKTGVYFAAFTKCDIDSARELNKEVSMKQYASPRIGITPTYIKK